MCCSVAAPHTYILYTQYNHQVTLLQHIVKHMAVTVFIVPIVALMFKCTENMCCLVTVSCNTLMSRLYLTQDLRVHVIV